MNIFTLIRAIFAVVIAVTATANSYAQTDISTNPLTTYNASTTIPVKPNILYVMDDSGSMAWDFLPDAACGAASRTNSSCNSTADSPAVPTPDYLFKNHSYNGIYYDSATTYTPPTVVTATGQPDTTTHPSMTGTSAATGGTTWSAAPVDGYGIQSNSTVNLVTTTSKPYFYTTIPGEYCTTTALRSCNVQTAPSAGYPYPAYVRWCSDAALTTGCQAAFDESAAAQYFRAPSPATATITVAGSVSSQLSGITVGGLQIMSAASTASTSSSTVAANIAAQINACSSSLPSGTQCTTIGYSATSNGSVVTISAPGITTATPTVTQTGTMTFAVTAFAAGSVPGYVLRTTITPDVASYGYAPGYNFTNSGFTSATTYPSPSSSPVKAATRTDCAASTCTYQEEMTNYANWWAYYHTRLQMIKTALSNATAALDTPANVAAGITNFRLGFMTINNNAGNEFAPMNDFSGVNKYNWSAALLKAKAGNSTPLGEWLSKAGEYYAGTLNSSTINGVTVPADPMQYSCQHNYTILSTDGYWNVTSGFVKMDGTTAVGNQDNTLAPPYWDGAANTIQSQTSNLQTRSVTPTFQVQTSSLQQQPVTTTYQSQTSYLQSQTTQLQATTRQLMISTSSKKTSGYSTPVATSSCTYNTNGVTVGSTTTYTKCSYGGTTTVTGVATCAVNASTGTSGAYQGPTAVTACNSVITAPYANTASTCTATTTPNASGNTTQCKYSAYTTAVTVPSCSTQAPSGGSPYTVTTATKCTGPTVTPGTWANVAAGDTCTTSAANNCRYTSWSTATSQTSCSALPQSTSSPYSVVTAVKCTAGTPQYGTWTNAATCTTAADTQCAYTAWSGWTTVASCTATPQSPASPYLVGTAINCKTTASGGTSNTLADVAAYYYGTDLRAPAPGGNGNCTSAAGNDLCADNVPVVSSLSGGDSEVFQHMTTYTLGLGAQGETIYAPQDGLNYWNDSSGDFYSIRYLQSANSSTGVCTWLPDGTKCYWPIPVSNTNTAVDDLWHAAVNGHGMYFNAKNPGALSTALNSIFGAISNVPNNGDQSAAATSTPNITSTNNLFFTSKFESVYWYGDLDKYTINVSTTNSAVDGSLSALNWSAQQLLDCTTTPWTPGFAYVGTKQGPPVVPGMVYRDPSNTACHVVTADYTSGATYDTSATGVDMANTTVLNQNAAAASLVAVTPQTTRNVYTKKDSSNTLIPFTWSSLSSAQQSYFMPAALTYSATTPQTGLSQFCSTGTNCLSSTAQSNYTIAPAPNNGAAGEALVNFLAGDRSNEGTFYRVRPHVLGDIVDSVASYVGSSLYNYADANYGDFSTATKARNGVVYVGSNDGMLHAFDAVLGQEKWAYIPTFVLPNLYILADKNYSLATSSLHQFFVDGSPQSSDICPNAPSSTCTSSQWKTILVGGLNRGGKGYYAMDVTNENSPTLLWEFTDTHMGYSYGNPVITKLADGTWVVLVTSGYNNDDGVGRLYILNAATGSVIRTISTGVGSPTSPNGLAQISAYVAAPMTDNTAVAVYGGDLYGNLWRFDINGTYAPLYGALKIITFTDASGTPQPVTETPVVSVINNFPVVFVGTGKFLGVSDVLSTQVQSFYAVKDNLGSTTYTGGVTSAGNKFVQQTLTATTSCPAGDTFCSSSSANLTVTNNTVDWNTNNGWYFNFVNAGERSYTDPSLGLGSLLFTTIVPQTSAAEVCVVGNSSATSYFYDVNYLTGSSVVAGGNTNVLGVSLGSIYATSVTMFETNSGKVGGYIDSQKDPTYVNPPTNPPGAALTRRVSWRELPTQ